MAWLNALLVLYALLSIGMGLEAYFAKSSLISLVAGGVAGALVLASVAWSKTNPRPGRILAAVVTLLMLGRFLPAYFRTGAFYPAGLLALASAVVLACLVGAHFYARRRAGEAQHARE